MQLGTATDHRPTIVFVNRSYWPDHEATGQLLTDLCTFLVDQFDVHVICGQPNSSDAVADFTRSGCQVHQGVTIHRLEHLTFPKRWPAGRLLNLMSFTRATRKYLKQCSVDAEIFVCETDPFLLPPVVAAHSTRNASRFVAYLQDIYPDVAVAIGKAREGWVTQVLRKRLRDAYRMADRVIVLGEDMRTRLVGWGLDGSRMHIVPNWVDCDHVRPIKEGNDFRQQHQLQQSFVIMHSGNMGLTQRLEYVIEATTLPQWPQDAVLLLVGDGAARKSLESLAESLASQHVRFLPYQPRSELAQSLSAADLHLISMDERITGCLFPSKFYGILASATPALMIAPLQSEPARIVREQQIGWTCQPGSPQAIANAVAEARRSADLSAMGQRARELALREYDRTVACQRFATILSEMLTTNSDSGTFSFPDLVTA